ncbi:MAG: hypothetical protein A2252_01795 [Elusimicrobia bacterium RIFOXYA2_FULL_39_19]|nr:MAG: hypothetical protein A2252_01795 [Elusimicrobia bacterium RIFOXYA2_FULL_39_19]
MGMGGAYTAIGDSSLAGYWNPAALYGQDGFDLKLNLGAGMDFTGSILEKANNIADFSTQLGELETSQQNGGNLDIRKISAITTAMKNLQELGSGSSGMVMNISGGLGLRIGRYVLSVNNYSFISAKPKIELFGFYLGSATVDASALGIRKSSNRLLIPNDSDSETQELQGIAIDASSQTIADPTNSALLNERDDLETQISWIKTALKDAGVEVPAGLTDQQIANALINTAVNNNVTEEELQTSIATVKESRELLEMVLGGSDPTKTFSDNQSNLTFRGLNITEIGIGSAWPLYFENLYAGVTLKYMTGAYGFYRQNIFENETELGDSVDLIANNTKQSSQIGLDVGLLYNKKQDWNATFGLTMKNLNSPTFTAPAAAKEYGEEDIKFDPQIRLGAAYYVFNFWSLSTDMDLTSNKSLIPGYETKMFSFGTEINLINQSWLNLPFRFGMMKNLAASDEGIIMTAGLGMNLGGFTIDFSGAVGASTTKVKADSEAIPENANMQVSIAFDF